MHLGRHPYGHLLCPDIITQILFEVACQMSGRCGIQVQKILRHPHISYLNTHLGFLVASLTKAVAGSQFSHQQFILTTKHFLSFPSTSQLPLVISTLRYFKFLSLPHLLFSFLLFLVPPSFTRGRHGFVESLYRVSSIPSQLFAIISFSEFGL